MTTAVTPVPGLANYFPRLMRVASKLCGDRAWSPWRHPPLGSPFQLFMISSSEKRPELAKKLLGDETPCILLIVSFDRRDEARFVIAEDGRVVKDFIDAEERNPQFSAAFSDTHDFQILEAILATHE